MSDSADRTPVPPTTRPSFRDVITALRPSQWTKNLIVLAAFFFAFWDRARPQPLAVSDLLIVVPAMLLFCLTSSSIYLLNDIRDVEADRAHPLKRFRPIAAGRLSPALAGWISTGLLVLSAAGSWILSPRFFLVIAAYIVLQAAYTFWLKRIALVDIIVIASGFVLRAIAGAVVLKDVTISPWLLLCAFLLALFLALCKRRQEKVSADDDAAPLQRASLAVYHERLLDVLIGITSAVTIASYSIYTLWPGTVEKFGTHALGFTIPFVIFGIFRYLDLVYRHSEGERPEKVLLKDGPLLVNLVLYGLVLFIIFHFKM